jgi:hypothetical protein
LAKSRLNRTTKEEEYIAGIYIPEKLGGVSTRQEALDEYA